ncbi:MAG: hypothetical protein BM485_00430 [Desulfobulbaceae bacterium DB1]|nr:MAG: hypothetical protein BM485_00430 [Desulfobulbaceae bacterium DB1]
MFNPEKLLGSLLKGGLGRGGATRNLKVQAGLGLLGAALAAVDHYANKSSSRPQDMRQGTKGADYPPASGYTAASTAMATPPPPPPPPHPPAMQAEAANRQQDAVLLIRAMIAAANADGTVDQEERQRILEKFRAANLSPEEQSFLAGELLNPADIDQLAAGVHSAETARQLYAVSLLAITVDSDAERAYLQTLADRLGLSAPERDFIHKNLGVEGVEAAM